MFGNKKVEAPAKAVVETPYEKDIGYEDAKAALKRFEARVRAAKDAHKLPVNQHRIRRDGAKWWCEAAYANVSDYPQFEGERPKIVLFVDDPRGALALMNTPRYRAVDYDAAKPSPAKTEWQPIGPYGITGADYKGSPENGVMWFNSYPDAERWLTDYLRPEANTVYFSADGERAIEAKEGDGDE